MKKIIGIFSLFLVGTLLNGCRKTLDVNKNPNNPLDVNVEVLLPSAQASIGQQLGNYFQIVGGIWGQYWTQNPNSSQYRALEQYQPGPSTANIAWSELYSGALKNLDVIVKKSDTVAALQNYKAIAMLLEAYTYQLLTDNFNDIPYSEAIKGDLGISSPRYDRQEDVYNGIISMAKQARDLIDDTAPTPSTDDIIYQGNMESWYRFANTLLLRMYLRLAYVRPTRAQQGIDSLNGELFIEAGSGANLNYLDQAGRANPLYSELVNLNRTQNLVASATSFDTLNAKGDERIAVFYELVGTGLPQGFYNTPLPGTYALPGVQTGGLANPSTYGESEAVAQRAPVRFISSYESYLLQAEATARGWLSSAGAEDELYSNAVHANYVEFGLEDTLARDYVAAYPYPTGASLNDKIGFIITEKWFCMNGNQGIEAWTEWRRTGFPTFFTVSRTSRIGNVFPQRLPYPETEVTRNLNFPGQKAVTDKVWWDVN